MTVDGNGERIWQLIYLFKKIIIPAFDMNLMQNSYHDNRDIELHYRDIRIFIIAQPYCSLSL